MEDVELPQIRQGSFAVETEVYSGPLDLLIDLIEKRKLLINDISLASVTDDYMRYVAALEDGHMDETADFVVLAATLLLIKSKSLLPVLELTENEEEETEHLKDRLRLYQIFRTAGKIVEESFGRCMAGERRFVMNESPIFMTDKYTTTDALASVLSEVIQKLPKPTFKPTVKVRPVMSLEEMIGKLQSRIQQEMSVRFKDFTGDSKERGTIIVGFLAVLEMVKQGLVMVNQSAHFEEIHIERESGSVPKYL